MEVGVDFEAVKRNAERDGIDLQEITIVYEDLTPDEIEMLATRQLIKRQSPGRGLLAKFPLEGEPLFPDKATAVLYLGA